MMKQRQTIDSQRGLVIDAKCKLQSAAVDLTNTGDFDNAAKLNMALQLVDSVELNLQIQYSKLPH